MSFTPLRALIFFIISLPIGFIGVAFALAVMQGGVTAAAILPWALMIAACAGLLGGLQRGTQ